MKNFEKLREATRVMERNLEKLNGPDMDCENLTLAQCHVLVETGQLENSSLKGLAEALNLDSSTVSKTVESLVKKGYVSRNNLPANRRMVSISLTPEGAGVFQRVEDDMNLRFQKICAHLSESELNAVIDALKSYNSAMEECL